MGKYSILIMGDSRIKHLDRVLMLEKEDDYEYEQFEFEIISKPGGGVMEVVNNSITHMRKQRYHQAMLMAGVCELSFKHGRRLYPCDYSHHTENLVDHMQTKYTEAYDKICVFTDCPVICDLVGMDLAMYNRKRYDDDYLQRVINESVPLINNWLHTFMKAKPTQACTPYYASYVYKRRNQRTSCRYNKATRDGLHFTDYYLQMIARQILEAVRKNKESIHPEV